MGLHSFVLRAGPRAAGELGQGCWQTCSPGLLSWLTQERPAEVKLAQLCLYIWPARPGVPADLHMGCCEGRGLSCSPPRCQNLNNALSQTEALGCAEGSVGNVSCHNHLQG